MAEGDVPMPEDSQMDFGDSSRKGAMDTSFADSQVGAPKWQKILVVVLAILIVAGLTVGAIYLVKSYTT